MHNQLDFHNLDFHSVKKAGGCDEKPIVGPWACRLVAPRPPWGTVFGPKSPIIRGDLLRNRRLLAAGKCRTHPLVANSQN